LELEIAEKKRRGQEKRREAGEGKTEGKIMRIVWDKMAIQEFRERTEELCMIEEEEQGSLTIENKWIRIRQIVNEAMVKKEIRRKRMLGYKDWWDKSCTTMKRRMKRIYSRWRKEKVVRGRYVEERKLFKKWLEKKQKEKREEEEEELKKIKRKTEV